MMTHTGHIPGRVDGAVVDSGVVLVSRSHGNGVYDPDWLWDIDIALPLYGTPAILAGAWLRYTEQHIGLEHLPLIGLPLAIVAVLFVIDRVRRHRGRSCAGEALGLDETSDQAVAGSTARDVQLYCEGDPIELEHLVVGLQEAPKDVRVLRWNPVVYITIWKVGLVGLLLGNFIETDVLRWIGAGLMAAIVVVGGVHCLLGAEKLEVVGAALRVRPVGLVRRLLGKERVLQLNGAQVHCSYSEGELRITTREGQTSLLLLDSIARRHALVRSVFGAARSGE